MTRGCRRSKSRQPLGFLCRGKTQAQLVATRCGMVTQCHVMRVTTKVRRRQLMIHQLEIGNSIIALFLFLKQYAARQTRVFNINIFSLVFLYAAKGTISHLHGRAGKSSAIQVPAFDQDTCK